MAPSDPVAMPDGVPAERVDELYGLPLEQFTAARDRLSQELKEGGRGEQAAWVKGLRKPTAAAWVANQLARTQKRAAGELLEAARQLRAAHEGLLGGRGSGEELRAAAEREQRAVGALIARAAGLLDQAGRSPSSSTLDKVSETLRTVALDEAVHDQFAAGRLTRERRSSGLGPFAGAPAGESEAAGAGEAAAGKSGQPSAAERARARQALKEARGDQRERQRAVKRAERDLDHARREVERAQAGMEQATEALERARAQEADAAARVAEPENEARRSA